MNYVLHTNSSYITGACNALVTIGIAIGSMASNHLLNNTLKKRRSFLLMTDIIGIISSTLQLFGFLPVILVGRLLGGISAYFFYKKIIIFNLLLSLSLFLYTGVLIF